MLDEQELLATRVLNKKAKWEDVQKFIDKKYIKKEKAIKIITEFSDIFINSLCMLDEEIIENKENCNTLIDVNNLKNEWNKIYDKYFTE